MSETEEAMKAVKLSIENLIKSNNIKNTVRLVAVSKTKPSSQILEVYKTGHKNFGENYIQEICDKSKELPEDIEWHFIGALQSNKVKKLLEVKNLKFVETVDRQKIASTLNDAISNLKRDPLNVFVQINTSDEENKGGASTKDFISLVEFIIEKCPNLKFKGLMTIGSVQNSKSESDLNPDFQKLCDCRDELSEKLNLPKEDIELSMGMSSDYQQAIIQGSTNVRVGSSIFGGRIYKK
eukprot:gene12636-6540_t